MPARRTSELYLQIGGDANGLDNASKVGKTALLNLGGAADDIQAEVTKAFQAMAANAPSALKALEQSYDRTFKQIRRNAQMLADAPTGGDAIKVLNLAGTQAAVAAAEREAASLRVLADAAAVVAQREGETAQESRVLATAFEAQAQEGLKYAAGLRSQASALELVQTEAARLHGVEGATVPLIEEHTRARGRNNIATMEGEHVVRSFADSVAAGRSPLAAFAMELPRMTEAMSFWAMTTEQTGGKLGALAAFLSGPWGLAIGAGLAVLAPMVGKLFEESEASKEAAKAVEEHKKAIEQLIEAEHKALMSEDDRLRADAIGIESERRKREAIVKTTIALLEQAKANLDANKQRSSGPGERGELAALGADVNQNQAGALETALAAARKSLEQGAGASSIALNRLIANKVEERGSPEGIVKAAYEQQKNALLSDRSKSPREVATELATLNKERDRELEIIKESNKVHRARNTSAAESRQGDLVAEIKKLFPAATITSTFRPGAITSSGRPSDHGVDGRALDFAMPGMGSWTRDQAEAFKAHVRETLVGAGIRIRRNAQGVEQLFVAPFDPAERGHRPHVHVAVEGGVKSTDQLDRMGETRDRKAEAARENAARNAEAYEQLMDRAREEQLRITHSLVTSAQGQADIEVQEAAKERERLDAAVQLGVVTKRWSQAEADALKIVYADNEAQKDILAFHRLAQKQLDQQLNAQRRQTDGELALLKLQYDLARTSKERHDLALQILALEEAEARAAAIRKTQSDNPETQAEGRAELGRIDAQHKSKVEEANRQNQDPLQQYLEGLKRSSGDMNDALKGVEADGLKGLEDGLLGIIEGTQTVGQAFSKMAASIIADLARILVERLILKAILGDSGDGGSIWGSNPGSSDSGGFSTGGIPGYAGGGSPRLISGPGSGTSDSILAIFGGRKPIRVSNGESINTAASTRRYWPLIDAMNKGNLPGFADGGMPDLSTLAYPSLPSPAALQRASANRDVIYVQVDKSALFDTHVQRVAAPMAQAAAIGGSRLAQQEMAERQMQAIPS